MRVMVIVKANEASEAGVMPPPELFAAMDKYNQALSQAGILLAADGLHPSSRGVCASMPSMRRGTTAWPLSIAAAVVRRISERPEPTLARPTGERRCA